MTTPESTSDSQASTDGEPHVETTLETVTARRSPRYGRLMVTGAIVFIVVATILTFAFEPQEGTSRTAVWGMMLVIGAAVGAGLGALLALLLGRLARNRTHTITMERLSVTDEADSTTDEADDSAADDSAQE